jgi:hypothetical protein
LDLAGLYRAMVHSRYDQTAQITAHLNLGSAMNEEAHQVSLNRRTINEAEGRAYLQCFIQVHISKLNQLNGGDHLYEIKYILACLIHDHNIGNLVVNSLKG